MPVRIRRIKGSKLVKVSTPSGTKAKRTTRAKAEAQKRLLNAVEHSNWRPTGKPPKKGYVVGKRKG